MTAYLRLVLGLAVAAAAWFLLAPAQLGGGASYVVVQGASMEPGLGRGDLVIVRKAGAYREGDAVAYRHPELRRTVLHRIVAVEGDRLQLRGDANSFTDFDTPRRVEVLGRQWLHVPHAGRVVEWLRAPEHAAVSVAALALLLGAGSAAGAATRRAAGRRFPQLTGPNLEAALLALAGGGVLLLAVGLVALARPATSEVAWGGLYRHHGSFSYSGEARPGDAYPSGRVQTGSTAFVRLVPSLRVRFDYRLDSDADRSLTGEAWLVARVEGGNGWSRELALVRRRSFEGDETRLEANVDLRGLLALGRRVALQTGTVSDSYLLTLRPRVRVAGEVGGQAVSDRFAPALALRLDEQKLRLEQPGDLVPTAAGAAVRREARPFGPVTVSTARAIGLVGGLVALGLAAAGWFLTRSSGARDEPARIAAELGAWLVEASPREWPEGVHELASVEDLVRVAERYERVILHEQRGREHSYVVEDGRSIYRYRAWGLERPSGAAEAEDRWTSLRRLPAA